MRAHLRYFIKNKMDLKSRDYVLFDNHHPKGPHVHINDHEFPYGYVNDNQLIADFEMMVLKELEVEL